jgi:cysteine desulfurase
MNSKMSYLDNAASTPVRGSSLQAFLDACKVVGNPDSVHSRGQAARAVLDAAREDIAEILGCEPIEIIFTSGGTESVNLAIRGLFHARQVGAEQGRPRHAILSSPLEHQAGLASLELLANTAAARVVHLTPRAGLIEPADFESAISASAAEIALASFMWVNNETGAITDVVSLAKLANSQGIPLHTDAVAALGKIRIDFHGSQLAAMSICGHKVGAPVGIGALVLRRDVTLSPDLLRGGEQERGLRPGTTNHALAAALAVAVRESVLELEQQQALHRSWSKRIFDQVQSVAPSAYQTISDEHRVASTIHIQLPECDSAALVFALDLLGVAVSSGAACQAGVQGPSHVLLGMGYSNQQAERGLRISFGHATTEQDVENLLRAFPAAYQQALAASQLS